ncbi:DUF4365 domain-containing protein [Marinihelvus fidelis]|uniref:DUF4365 domain-containing protein n=1 Tax=Marinihelvus fidelis TaxID=2613842 RepID=A0A5N0T855_9GAMM|nr:DUF4365 domain-containing protein [Marinihelvus fidelis]KAA9130327.1 DUF4365 domain-containing protein [Marinihelvus fidelis]
MSGPKISESQIIGNKGYQAFIANRPETWIVQDMSGDSDFGYDIFLQYYEDGRMKLPFHAQLKSSTKCSKLHGDGAYYSESLYGSTLNYFRKSGWPILLIYADLSDNVPAKDSKVFYSWIHEEFEEKLDGKSEFKDESSYTFRIPVSNQLTPETDISSFATRQVSTNIAVAKLIKISKQKLGSENPNQEGQFFSGLAILAQRLEGSTIAQIANEEIPDLVQKEAFASELHEIKSSIDNGRPDRALEQIEHLELETEGGAEALKARIQFLKGRAFAFKGIEEAALACYQMALSFDVTNEQYAVAVYESEIRASGDPINDGTICRILEDLEGTNSGKLALLKARLLASKDRFEEAHSILGESSCGETVVTRGIVCFQEGNYSESARILNRAIADGYLSERQQLLAEIFRLKSTAYELFGEYYQVLKLGKFDKSLQKAEARELWGWLVHCLQHLEQSGWPPNSELVVEVLANISSVTANQAEAHTWISRIRDSRGESDQTNSALAQISFELGRFDDAIKLLKSLPPNRMRAYNLAVCFYQVGDHTNLVDIVKNEISNQLVEDSDLHGGALCVGALAAHKLFEVTDEQEFVHELRKENDWREYLQLYEAFKRIEDSPLERHSILVELWDAYQLDRSASRIEESLLANLDASQKDQAEKIIQIIASIKERRHLQEFDVVKWTQALIELDQLDELLKVTSQAILDFEKSLHLRAIHAVALDLSGQSILAQKLLEDVLASDFSPAFVLEAYSSIAYRFGDTDLALKTLKSLIESTSDPLQKIYLLRNRFNLELFLGAGSSKLTRIALKIGELVDPKDEAQESIFLQLYLMSGVTRDEEGQSVGAEAFQSRLRQFTERFPDSKSLRSAEMDLGPSAPNIVEQINSAIGRSGSFQKLKEKSARELRFGVKLVPFIARPSDFLFEIPDVLYLWEVSKYSSKDAIEYHVQNRLGLDKNEIESKSVAGVPLLDLLTLIIAFDLGVLGLIFELFRKVAISKATIMYLRHLSHPVFGSQLSEKSKAISEELFKHLVQIDQPSSLAAKAGIDGNVGYNLLQDAKELVSRHGYSYICEDALARIWVCEGIDGSVSFDISDILVWCSTERLVSEIEHAQYIATLANWNLRGLLCRDKEVVALVGGALADWDGQSRAEELLMSDSYFVKMTNAIWDFTQPAASIFGSAARLGKELASQTGIVDGVLGAFNSVFVAKAIVRPDSRFSAVEAASMLLILQCQGLTAGDPEVKKIWNAFSYVVEREFGERMDQNKWESAIRGVGGMIAKVQVGKLDISSLEASAAETIFEVVKSGFTSDTHDYELLTKAYTDAVTYYVLNNSDETVPT